jgi:SAM-dependent MidA family methyltransferase
MTTDAAARPGPRWAGSRAGLVETIRDEILAAPGQRITFARYMETVLTEPGLGYYATSQLRPTRAGDFLTAPELHPFFGRCLARFVAAAWERAGAHARYVVQEYGAGRGQLRDDTLAGLEADGSPLAGRIAWQAVDLPAATAPSGRAPETRRAGDPEATSEARHASEPPDLVLANEYLDALPVHRLVQAAGLQEAWVGWRDGWFVETLAEPSDPALAAHLAADGVLLSEGQRADVCLAAPRWVTEVAGRLRGGGLLLVIDYGHEASELYGARRRAGSLLTYRDHRVGDDPFAAVGESDLTAHVDLTALRRAAAEAGLSLVGRATQARFLAGLGLGDLLADLGRDRATDLPAYLEARSAVVRFLDPRHLGAFAVVAWRRTCRAPDVRGADAAPDDAPTRDLPGFEPDT